MRYLILALALFAFLTVKAQKEFAPIGAEWYYTMNVSFNPPVTGYLKHKCIKDSVIEQQLVKVLEISYSTNHDSIVLVGYEYLMQKGDTIFYWKSGEFHMLYNFSLFMGDSLLLYSEMRNQCAEQTKYGWSTIDTTYTVTLNNTELKAYKSSATKGSVWGWSEQGLPIYEGIGCLQYLFPQNTFCGVYDGIPAYGSLRCYSDNSLGFVQFSPNIACDSTSNFRIGNELFTKPARFSVYPNPTNSFIYIKIVDSQLQENIKAEILDISGNVKIEMWIEGCKAFIDLSSLPRGSYIVLFTLNGKNIYNEKISKK